MEKEIKYRQLLMGPALITGIILLMPLVGMQFFEGVQWTLSDFLIAGLLLFGTGFCYKILTRTSTKMVYKMAWGLALFAGLFLIWINLAVGVIGSENNAINLLYFGVIAVGVTGSLIARFKPYGMMRSMLAMAITQLSITIFALAVGMHNTINSSIVEIVGVNGLFVLLFLLAGVLFYKSDKNKRIAKRNAISS